MARTLSFITGENQDIFRDIAPLLNMQACLDWLIKYVPRYLISVADPDHFIENPDLEAWSKSGLELQSGTNT